MLIRTTFRTPTVAIAVVVILAADTGGQQTPSTPRTLPAGQAKFRSAVELVALNVTVRDGRQRFVQGLSRDDSLVYENGVPQEIAFFGSADVPMDLALVLDLSASMAGKMTFLRQASTGFLRALRAGDRAMLIGFNERVEVLQPLTAELAPLEDALRAMQAGGRTALYEGVYVTVAEFGRERRAYSDVRRRAVVILSDGLDTASRIGSDDALAVAQRSGASMYTVSLEIAPAPNGPPPDRATLEAKYTLNLLARDSGGRMFLPKTLDDLPACTSRSPRRSPTRTCWPTLPSVVRQMGSFGRSSSASRPRWMRKSGHETATTLSRPE